MAIWSYISHFKSEFDGVKNKVSSPACLEELLMLAMIFSSISHSFQVGFWWYKEQSSSTQLTQFNKYNQFYATNLEWSKTKFQFQLEQSLAQLNLAWFQFWCESWLSCEHHVLCLLRLFSPSLLQVFFVLFIHKLSYL